MLCLHISMPVSAQGVYAVALSLCVTADVIMLGYQALKALVSDTCLSLTLNGFCVGVLHTVIIHKLSHVTKFVCCQCAHGFGTG